MTYEFYGSFIVFTVVALWRSQLRTLTLSALFAALAALQSFFALFVAGILIAELFLHNARGS
jgi:hypothetical protein